MLTSFWRRLGRLAASRPISPAEFRAEQMDGSWQPEYAALRRHDAPALGPMVHLLYR